MNIKKLVIILCCVAVIAAAAAIFSKNGKLGFVKQNNQANQAKQEEQVPRESKGKYVPEMKFVQAPKNPDGTPLSKDVIVMATATAKIIKEAKAVVAGASLVTKDGIAITASGTPTRLNVNINSSFAPQISDPINISDIPTGKDTVTVSASGTECFPASFTVKEGQLVNFAFYAADKLEHFLFPLDQSLAGMSIGASGEKALVKSWNAPKKGTYSLECVLIGSKTRGGEIKMYVQ